MTIWQAMALSARACYSAAKEAPMENDKVLTTLREEAQRLERRLRAIRGAITGLSGSHGAASASKPHPAAPAKKRTLSAETRAKLSAAARKRWGKK